MKKILLRMVVFLLFATFAHGGPGKSSGNELRVDVGARAVAMGGVQFGEENGAFGLYYNPAFMANLSQKEAGLMHNEYILDVRQNVLSYAHPTEKGIYGAGITYFNYGTIDGYDKNDRKTGNVGASDLSVMGGWARQLDWGLGGMSFEDFKLGAALKLLRKELGSESAFAFAVDLGFVYPVKSERFKYLDKVNVAAAIQNLSNGIKVGSDTNELERVVRMGVGRSFWGDAVSVGLDGIMVSGSGLYPVVGVEYKLMNKVSVRAGYKGTRALEQRFSYGIGFENPLFSLDYAFVPFGDIEDTHRVSVRYRFGKSTAKPRADSQLKGKVTQAKTLYAQGQLVDAYIISLQVNHVAPWMDENNELLASIQKSFQELEESDKREKLLVQVNDLFARGEKFFEEGNLIDAQLNFETVIGLQPNHAGARGYLRQIEGHFQLFIENFYKEGLAAFAEEDYERAKSQFEKVLVINPNHPEARAQLAACIEILENRRKLEAAETKQENISRKYKEALNAYKAERYQESIALFKEALELDPANEEIRRYLTSANDILYRQYLLKAQEYSGRGEWEEAIHHLRLALEYNPQSMDAKDSLVNIQRRWDLQRRVASQNLYKEGLEAFLGGDKKRAKEIWQKSLELDPDNQEAKRGLSRLASEGK